MQFKKCSVSIKKLTSNQLFCISIIFFLFLINSITFSQNTIKKKIALLPFFSVGVDEISSHSAELILRFEFEQHKQINLIAEEKVLELLGEEFSIEIPFAIEIGKKLQADQVITCKLVALGQKVIVQYMLIDVLAEQVLLLDKATSTTVEDLDTVMKRIAAAITLQESFEKTAKIDAITDKETIEPRRRSAHSFAGFSFGYLYPQNGYDDADRLFSMDFRTGAEMKFYTVGMLLALRKGFAMNVYASYLFTKTDFCPFIGGGFGFHWVSHQNSYLYDEYGYPLEEKKKKDGFELTSNIGFKAFHTYNFHINVNLAYIYTFNDFDDRALVFTIGLLH